MITRKLLLLLLLISTPILAQVSYSAIIPANPPGGVGGACFSTAIAYLQPITGGNRIVTCDPSSHLWVVGGGGSGGGSPAGSAGNLQTKLNASTFGASTITGNTAGATYGDSATLPLISDFTPLLDTNGAVSTFFWGQYLGIGGFDGTQGTLRILDISNPASPLAVSTITSIAAVNGFLWSTLVFGKFAYFSDSGVGIWQTWDVSNINTPALVSTITVPDSPSVIYGAVVTDGTVLIATENLAGNAGHFYSYDITNKASPVLLGTLNLSGAGNACGFQHCLLIRGPLAYTALTGGSGIGTPGGFEIVDVSNPAAMDAKATVTFADTSTVNVSTTGLALDGDYLYVSVGGFGFTGTCNAMTGVNCALRIYNIKDATSPTLVAAYFNATTYNGGDLVLNNKQLYMTFGNMITGSTCPAQCELQVLDVSNPFSITAVAGINDDSGIADVSLLGKNLAFLDFGSNGFLYELPGVSVPAIQAGSIKAEDVQSNGDVRGEGIIYGGTSVKAGPGGVGSQGPISGTVLRLGGDSAQSVLAPKTSVSATAPGAGRASLRWVAGTNVGTCKLVSNAGTSATEVTIIDNVGGGC